MNVNGSVIVQRQLRPCRGKLRVNKLRMSFCGDHGAAITNLALLDSALPWTDWVEMDCIPSEGKLLQVIEVTKTSLQEMFSSSQDLNMAWQEVQSQLLAIVKSQAEKAEAP